MSNGKRGATPAPARRREKTNGKSPRAAKVRNIPDSTPQKVTNALVLQGGGALGAYEMGVVDRLYEEPGFAPAIISGVSIGAVNATVLAGAPKGKPVETLKELWRRITVSCPPMPSIPGENLIERMLPMFGIQDFFRPRTDYYDFLKWTSMCDVEPQRNLLQELVDFDRLNQDEAMPLLILTATNISTGNMVVFANKIYDKQAGKYRPAGAKGITPDHVLASGAIPPGFPMVKIHGEYYWDGGLFSNTPLAPVVESLDRVAAGDRKRIFLVNLYPNVGKIPENMVEVFNRMGELHFSNKMIFDVRQMNRTNQYVHMMTIFDKILTMLGEGSPRHKALASQIRNLDSFRWMMSYNCIEDIVLIQNHEPEPAIPETDFSEETLARRMSAGYRDADLKLEELGEQEIGIRQLADLHAALDDLDHIKLSKEGEASRRQPYRPRGLINHNGR